MIYATDSCLCKFWQEMLSDDLITKAHIKNVLKRNLHVSITGFSEGDPYQVHVYTREFHAVSTVKPLI